MNNDKWSEWELSVLWVLYDALDPYDEQGREIIRKTIYQKPQR